jgi:hypothetical protein
VQQDDRLDLAGPMGRKGGSAATRQSWPQVSTELAELDGVTVPDVKPGRRPQAVAAAGGLLFAASARMAVCGALASSPGGAFGAASYRFVTSHPDVDLRPGYFERPSGWPRSRACWPRPCSPRSAWRSGTELPLPAS